MIRGARGLGVGFLWATLVVRIIELIDLLVCLKAILDVDLETRLVCTSVLVTILCLRMWPPVVKGLTDGPTMLRCLCGI